MCSRVFLFLPRDGAVARGLDDVGLVQLLEALRDRAALPVADGAAVDGDDGDLAGERAGDKGLVGRVDLGEREVALLDGDAVLRAEGEDGGARDAVELVLRRRCPDGAVADDEKVRRVARGHKAVDVEHERLVGAGGGGLDARRDAVELAQRVPHWVLDVARPAADVRCEKRDAADPGRVGVVLDGFPLGNDGDGREANRRLWVLVRRRLEAARDDEADVDVGIHFVCVAGFVDFIDHLLLGAAEVHGQRRGALEEAVHVLLRGEEHAGVEPDALPDAVAEEEARVEDGDGRVGAAHEHKRDARRVGGLDRVAPQVDPNVRVALRVLVLVRHDSVSAVPCLPLLVQ
mmetsp:Transcript_6772/g.21852  ORF Transcript_6772/g.21852 Transcript_6772/m.21852 type:complete len:346 (+) Transcript_6772:14-1051(+)